MFYQLYNYHIAFNKFFIPRTDHNEVLQKMFKKLQAPPMNINMNPIPLSYDC